jgi:hypothetical protein
MNFRSGEEAFGVLMDFFAWAKLPMVRLWEEETAKGKNFFSYEISFIVGGMSWVPQVEFEDLQEIIPKERTNVIVRTEFGFVLFLYFLGSVILKSNLFNFTGIEGCWSPHIR